MTVAEWIVLIYGSRHLALLVHTHRWLMPVTTSPYTSTTSAAVALTSLSAAQETGNKWLRWPTDQPSLSINDNKTAAEVRHPWRISKYSCYWGLSVWLWRQRRLPRRWGVWINLDCISCSCKILLLSSSTRDFVWPIDDWMSVDDYVTDSLGPQCIARVISRQLNC